jgi:hypothetical protein
MLDGEPVVAPRAGRAPRRDDRLGEDLLDADARPPRERIVVGNVTTRGSWESNCVSLRASSTGGRKSIRYP